MPLNLGDRAWEYELPLPEFPPPSEAQVSRCIIRLIEGITDSDAEMLQFAELWARYAFYTVFSMRDVHHASRSH